MTHVHTHPPNPAPTVFNTDVFKALAATNPLGRLTENKEVRFFVGFVGVWSLKKVDRWMDRWIDGYVCTVCCSISSV